VPPQVRAFAPPLRATHVCHRMTDFLILGRPYPSAILSRAGLRRNAMQSDGFPRAVAVALAFALAFAVSLFAIFAFGGLP
jgi:Flp pilus assembly protein protease CpaA